MVYATVMLIIFVSKSGSLPGSRSFFVIFGNAEQGETKKIR
jgi:hypothetical protein